MAKRILIVDDEPALLIAFKGILEADQVQVDTAETMGGAEDHLKTGAYDVVIVDLRLTGVLGEEGLEIIRYVKEFKPETHVILITGYGNPSIMEKAQQLGAAFYFEKPVSSGTLFNALKNLGIQYA
jgi:two-component system, response regulator RegA